jgi:hypothetical protein
MKKGSHDDKLSETENRFGGQCDWVIERSIAWIVQWSWLCRDHEGLPQCSEAFIKLSASARMLSLFASPFP